MGEIGVAVIGVVVVLGLGKKYRNKGFYWAEYSTPLSRSPRFSGRY